MFLHSGIYPRRNAKLCLTTDLSQMPQPVNEGSMADTSVCSDPLQLPPPLSNRRKTAYMVSNIHKQQQTHQKRGIPSIHVSTQMPESKCLVVS